MKMNAFDSVWLTHNYTFCCNSAVKNRRFPITFVLYNNLSLTFFILLFFIFYFLFLFFSSLFISDHTNPTNPATRKHRRAEDGADEAEGGPQSAPKGGQHPHPIRRGGSSHSQACEGSIGGKQRFSQYSTPPALLSLLLAPSPFFSTFFNLFFYVVKIALC
jgi:hypothetical protein